MVAHHAKRLARAVERARQIDVDDLLPLLVGEIAEHGPGHADAGVVEQDVDAAELVLDLANSARTEAESLTSVGTASARILAAPA